MKRVFSRIRYLAIILALSFPFQTVFAAARTARQHADEVIARGEGYTSATAITSIQSRKDRFFGHIVDKHLGLNPNSYATYNPVRSENKELRSEFILANEAVIDQARATAPGHVAGDGTVGEVRQNIEKVALHHYLFETLTYKRLPIAQQEGLTEMLTILSTDYTAAILAAGDPENKTQLLQNAIDTLNASVVWNNLTAVYNQVNHGLFFDNITELNTLITAATTGSPLSLSTRPTPGDKVTVITNIRAKIENLIGSFKEILIDISKAKYTTKLLDSRAQADVKNKMQRFIDSLHKPEVWDKLQTICTRLSVIDNASYGGLLNNITTLRGLIAVAATGATDPATGVPTSLSTRPNSAAKVAVIEGSVGPSPVIGIKPQIGNLIAIQRGTYATIFPGAPALTVPDAPALATEAFTYAMGLAGKQDNVVGESIDIYCPLPNPVPNPITANIVRMVSQTPWYRPHAAVGNVGTMVADVQRPEAGRIMVGFLRYSVVGAHPDGTAYQVGSLDYSTMYSIP